MHETGLILILLIAIALVVGLTARAGWHPFWALLIGSLFVGVASGLGGSTSVALITQGMGNMFQQIGLIVLLGAVLGVILENSGGAMALAQGLLRLTHAKAPALTLAAIGALVSIPVFCDSGFIILSRLNEAIRKHTGIPGATLALSLAGGLYTTHTLVPPTPGPVAAAGNLGAGDYLAWVMLVGLAVCLPVILIVWRWAVWMGSSIALETLGEITLKKNTLPSAWKSAIPILLPIILISWGMFLDREHPLKWITQPQIALGIAVITGLLLLGYRNFSFWTEWTGKAIQLSGPILIITAMGGAFGNVLKATPLAALCEKWLSGGTSSPWLLLFLAFGLAALLKTAQGSSTSALVIASSILAPMTEAAGMTSPASLALLVSSMGAGAMMISHANDSYFWVVSQFSGMAAADAYRSFSMMTVWMGLTAFIAVLLLAATLG